MKTELLATLATLSDQINALPEDPPPPAPDTPTGLNLISASTDDPAILLLGWDALPDGCVPILEEGGGPGDPYGEGNWTPQGAYLGLDAGTGARATYVLEVPTGRNILFRLSSQRVADGQTSAPCDPIPFTSPPSP